MYVREQYRKTGTSNGLVAAVLDYARLKVLQVHCTVATTNTPAVRLYERSGFTIYGTEPRSLKVGQIFYDEYLMVRRFD